MDRSGPVLVVAPLKDEADAICRRVVERGFPSNPAQVGTLACTAVPSLDMVIAVGGVGKAQFGVQAQHLLDQCRNATLLVCVGGAGQLSPGLFVGDVVVGTHTIEHDYRERFNPRPALPASAASGSSKSALLQTRPTKKRQPRFTPSNKCSHVSRI